MTMIGGRCMYDATGTYACQNIAANNKNAPYHKQTILERYQAATKTDPAAQAIADAKNAAIAARERYDNVLVAIREARAENKKTAGTWQGTLQQPAFREKMNKLTNDRDLAKYSVDATTEKLKKALVAAGRRPSANELSLMMRGNA
jgi:hypothetical protein